MKISVALAYYNGGKYIEEQMDSITKQLGEEDEVWVSVDAAEDGSEALLREIADADGRIRLTKGPGQGVVRNFEHAISKCTGDIIFLSDQDDVWAGNKVRKVLWAFEHSTASVVLHNGVLINENREILEEPTLFAMRKSRSGLAKNLWKNSYIGCCMAFRKELLPLILPIPPEMYMHDYWIGTAGEYLNGTVLLKEPLIYYRRHEDNVTELTHGSVSFMVKKRAGMLRCLQILAKRRAALDKESGLPENKKKKRRRGR